MGGIWQIWQTVTTNVSEVLFTNRFAPLAVEQHTDTALVDSSIRVQTHHKKFNGRNVSKKFRDMQCVDGNTGCETINKEKVEFSVLNRNNSSKPSIDDIRPSGNDFQPVGLTALVQKCKKLEKARKAVLIKHLFNKTGDFMALFLSHPYHLAFYTNPLKQIWIIWK